jgi:hypothetical protein
VVAVLLMGSIWRRRKRQEVEHLVLPDGGEVVQSIDRP